jgi:hypothetical protein
MQILIAETNLRAVIPQLVAGAPYSCMSHFQMCSKTKFLLLLGGEP